MQLTFSSDPLAQIAVDALVVGVPDGEKPSGEALAALNRAMGGALDLVWADGTFSGKDDQIEVLYPAKGLLAHRVVLVGLGQKPLSPEGWRKALAAGVGAVKGKSRRIAFTFPAGLPTAEAAAAGIEATVLAAYEFHPYQTKPDPDHRKFETVVLAGLSEGPVADAARSAASLAEIVNRVRDLANMPGNKMHVTALREAIGQVAQAAGLDHRVIEAPDLATQGFGLLCGVGQGSPFPPALVVLEYHGADPDAAPVVLVGKGITFDTGGICIKPRLGMEEMKTDMHGVASVVGVLEAAALRRLPVNLVAVLPLAENMPDGLAIKPGDILKAYNGASVEVIDTDAEGRLILADALAFAVKHYRPRAIIDMATLTGSIIMALGYEATGMFTNDNALAEQLARAGERTGERVWRMPLWDAYEAGIRSDLADWRNTAKEKGDAITGATFLKKFVGDVPWVHLDIAGPSYLAEAKDYRPKGSTGVGVRLLLDWLEQDIVGS